MFCIFWNHSLRTLKFHLPCTSGCLRVSSFKLNHPGFNCRSYANQVSICLLNCSNNNSSSSRNPLELMKRNLHTKITTDSSTNLMLEDFHAAFNNFVRKDVVREAGVVSSALSERLTAVLEYNVLNGKKIRGLAVVKGYEFLSGESSTGNDLSLSHILGWCVELLQAYYLVTDDVMDNSTHRRGKPCWFRNLDIGLAAVNDALMLEACIYSVLKKYFGTHNSYNAFMELFHEVNKFTIWGQCLDMMVNTENNKPNLGRYTLEHYWKITEFKTAHYTFRLPVHLAMLLVGGFNENHFRCTQEICIKIGNLFQMQDDYLDVYGDSHMTGKVGNDIGEGKCTWFAVMALSKATVDQKKIFQDFYGVNDTVAVLEIKRLYDMLKLKDCYISDEKKLISEIGNLISNIELPEIQTLFVNILKEISYRKK